jgi:hypothetical protein
VVLPASCPHSSVTELQKVNVIICYLCYCDQVKGDAMVSACSTNDNDEMCLQNFGRNASRKDTILIDVSVDGRMLALP